jgi:hypothetical protein
LFAKHSTQIELLFGRYCPAAQVTVDDSDLQSSALSDPFGEVVSVGHLFIP